jgi:hypothetical protein
MPRSRFSAALYRWRVRSGPWALLAALFLARPAWRSLGIGAAVGSLGLIVRAWAAGHIQKEKRLAITGPYRHSRNPLYVGNFILGIGITTAVNSWWGAAVFILYFALFYPPVIREECERMRRIFPDQYEDYASRVPLFLPRLTPAQASEDGRFRWSLYKRNKEFRAVLGAVAAWAVLILRMILAPRAIL